jgi:sugar phosphate isomerase/epimerase
LLKDQIQVKYRAQPYSSLPKSYKGVFPFKIGTTSFIYPDDYIPNVIMLGPYVDAIELLLFESRGVGTLPSLSLISELGRLAADFDLSYNVHLPTDISISDPDPVRRKSAVQRFKRVIDLVQPLNPSAMVLHVPYADGPFNEYDINTWRNDVRRNLVDILSTVESAEIIAIESLDYPLELWEDMIIDLNLSVCLDLGHLMVYDQDMLAAFDKFAPKTTVLHVHGVDNKSDHQSLAKLSDELFATVAQILGKFSGTVSLEVFSYSDLVSSLEYLENRWWNAQSFNF